MAFRFIALAAYSCLILAAGCDQAISPVAMPSVEATTAPATPAESATAPNTAIATAPRTRMSLGAIPLSMEVPSGWLLRPGVTGRIVLHGPTPSGEVDVLLGTGPSIKGEALPLMVKESAKPSTDRYVKNEVTQRDGMTIIQRIAPQTPPGTLPGSDPNLVPIGWTAQCIVTDGKLDYSVYELTILGLSQAMFDRDQQFLQELLDTLKHEAPATQPATP